MALLYKLLPFIYTFTQVSVFEQIQRNDGVSKLKEAGSTGTWTSHGPDEWVVIGLLLPF